jgi:hypothetical protein
MQRFEEWLAARKERAEKGGPARPAT